MLIDSGNRLEEHGAFNMLVFAIMFTPLNIIMLIGYNWWRLAAGGKNGTNKRFIIQLVAFIIFSIVALACLTTRDRAWAKHGFFDQTIQGSQDEGFCEWKPTTAWLQLLPFRQNFFVVRGIPVCEIAEGLTIDLGPTNMLTRQLFLCTFRP